VDQDLDVRSDGDPCGDETYAGRRESNVLIWCEDAAAWKYGVVVEELRCGTVFAGFDGRE
jgi:hypothetical protein